MISTIARADDRTDRTNGHTEDDSHVRRTIGREQAIVTSDDIGLHRPSFRELMQKTGLIKYD